jgi:hypothetical protein
MLDLAIVQIDNALSPEVCQRLLAYAEEQLRSAPDAATYQWVDPQGEALEIAKNLTRYCVGYVRSAYKRRVMSTSLGISRYSPGKCLPVHADCHPDGNGGWTLRPEVPRLIGAFCYLNENFVGGELVFPDLGVTIRPKTGLLAMWPGDPAYLHEVRPIQSGYRYAVGIALHEVGQC